MTIQLGHESLAESHDLGIASAAGIKVGTALGAAHGQAGQAVLKGLLEAQELHDGQVDGGMEAQAALVGADGAVELHTETAVDMGLASIVNPRDAEHDLALGLDHSLKQSNLLILGVLLDNGNQRLKNLFDGLVELRLVGIALLHSVDDSGNVLVHDSFLLKNILTD